MQDFDGKKLIISEPSLDIHFEEPFSPLMIPENPKHGHTFSDGSILKIYKSSYELPSEITIEKNGVRNGQSYLFYPSGKLKATCFYLNGHLHGPSTFFTEEGQETAKSWFFQGKREGKSVWHYATGALYSVQFFKDGKWEGKQEYFYPNGSPKSVIYYKDGVQTGEVHLFDKEGKQVRCTSLTKKAKR